VDPRHGRGCLLNRMPNVDTPRGTRQPAPVDRHRLV